MSTESHALHGVSSSHEAHGPHVLSIRTNVIVYLILLGLLVLTIGAALIDPRTLGLPAWFGLSLAMSIATIKAVIILLYFMHVKFSPPLVWVFSTAAFFWLLILLAFTFNDYFSRAWLLLLGK